MTFDKNHCRTTFKYTKSLEFRILPMLKNTERYITITMKAKEVLVHKSAFPKSLIGLAEPPIISPGIAI